MATAGASPLTLEVDQPPSPDALKAMVQARLPDLLPDGDDVLTLSAREALLGPGKRVRPVLAMLAAEHVGGRAEAALDFGCAIEMTHAASLALDDLPCMDDAALRRGGPTLHRRRGEDAAILAAVALLNQSSRVILAAPASADRRIAALDLLTRAVGFDGLAGGQMRDLRDGDGDGRRTAGDLRRINDLKTGALFVAAVRGAALLGGATGPTLDRMADFGAAIGFAFQLCDDLLDALSTIEVEGKDVGQDGDMVTFVDLWGPGRVRAAVRQSLNRAGEAVGHDDALMRYVLSVFQHAAIGL